MRKKLLATVCMFLAVASIGLFTFINQSVVSADVTLPPIYATEDTTIVYEGVNPNKIMYEDGNLGYLDVGYQGTFGVPLEVQVLLKYHLPPTPAGQEIQSAELYFPVMGGSLAGLSFSLKASTSTNHEWVQDTVTSDTLPAAIAGSTIARSVAGNAPMTKPVLGPFDFTSYITEESLKADPRATFILSGFTAEQAQAANISYQDHYIQTAETHTHSITRPFLILTYTEIVNIEITGVTDGGLYNSNVTPVFNVGTATLNGAPFTSGTTVVNEGTYTLVVTQGSQTKTVQFSIDKTPPTATVLINNGSYFTNNQFVDVRITPDQGVNDIVSMRYSVNESNVSTTQPYHSEFSIGVGLDNGDKSVRVQLIDAAGNISPLYFWDFKLNTTIPTGTLTINSGATYTIEREVDLLITPDASANEIVTMQFSMDNNNWSSAEGYNPSKRYTLPAGDGDKTVYVRLTDRFGNIGIIQRSILLDMTPPTAAVLINNGDSYTNNANVAIEITPDADVNDIAFIKYTINGSAPTTIAYTNRFNINVGSTNEEKEIMITLIDRVGHNSPIYSSKITLDTVPPSGTVALNSGAAYTTAAEVTLNFTLGAGVTDVVSVQFSNDNLTWSSEQAYSASMSYTLPTGEGSKTVYVRFIDRAGNIGTAQASIILDTVAPTGTLTISSPNLTNATTVTLTVTSSDASFMELGEAGQPYKAKAAYSNSAQTYTLQDTQEDGVKTLHVRLSDLAGNTTVLTANVTLDRTAPTGTVAVNDGKPYTNDANVSVEVTPATGVTDIANIRYTINGSTPTTIAYTDSFILDVGTDGEKEIKVELLDGAGNVSPEYTSTITLDTVAPTGTVAINGGAAYTTAAEVTLNFTLGAGVTDVVSVQFSNDNLTWSSEQAYSASMSYTLPAGDGGKTVYVRFIDRAGNIGTAQASIILDTVAPTGTLTISSPDLTNATSVTLTVTSSDANFMELGEAGQAYKAKAAYSNSAQTYTLQDTQQDGVKTLQVRLSDLAGNTTVLTANVTLDRTAPTGTVVVNDGKPYTNDANVAVEVTPATGVTDIANIRYTINGSTPTTIAYTDSFILDVGTDGEKEIKVELLDGAGNVSPEYTSTITLDTVAPTGTVAINGGAAYTTAAEVTLNFTLGAGVTDVASVQFSNDNLTWSSEQAYSASKSYTLPTGDGSKTVYVRFIDRAGNTGTAQTSITLDTVAPTGQLVINHNEQFANSLELELTITTSDSSDLAGIQFSSDGTAWSALEAYASSKKWSVTGNGEKTVYVKFIDHAGNVYTASSSIYVDTVKPIVSIAVEDEAELTFSNVVDLTIEASDPGRDLKTAKLLMELSHDGISWLPEESYTPNKEWTVSSGFGTKQIYVRITDEAGNVSNIASATIVYRSIPKLNDHTVNATEDTRYTFALTDFPFTNDDGLKPDTYTLVTLPEHGLIMLEDQEIKAGAVVTAGQLAKLVYVPPYNWFGTEQLEWNASTDGVAAAASAVLTIEVAAVNDVPVAEDLELTLTKFSPAEGTLVAKDIEGDKLTFHIVDAPTQGKVVLDADTGEFIFTLDRNQNGTYIFTYRVFDGTDYSDIATVTIKYAVNIPVTETPVPTHGGVLKLGEQGADIEVAGSVNEQGSSIEIHLTDEQFAQLNKSHENQTIELSLTGSYSNAKLIISDKALNKLAGNGNRLLFTTPGLQYHLSNGDLKQMLATNRSSFVIAINHESKELLARAQEQAGKGAYQLIGAPITIELSALTDGINSLQLQGLGAIMLSSAGAGELPTALLKLLPNGIQSPILASIFIEGQSYRVHASYGAGTYTLIRKQPRFTDISGWSVKAIETLASKLILNGVNETTFEPLRAITRAEFASIISKALGLVNFFGSHHYTDVAAGAWYSDAVAAVAELGFMNGYPDGTYRPAQQITREEAMVIIARVLGYLGFNNVPSDSAADSILGEYSDQEQLSSWSRTDIALTVQEGIILGNNGKLTVKNQITREQVAAIIVRLLEYIEKIKK